jgi:hypothetical protein
MSVGTKTQVGSGPSGPAACGTNHWLIAVIVSVATFMEVLDMTIANVALRYISGGLAIGPSQAAWVVTSYLVAIGEDCSVAFHHLIDDRHGRVNCVKDGLLAMEVG